MRDNKKVKVAFFQRKPRSVGNYSVEYIFKDVKERLADKLEAYTIESRYESSGFFKRLYNCIDAYFKQKTVNHVTGDINYVGLFLSKSRTIQTILDCVHLEKSFGLKYKILKLFWLQIPEKRARYLTAISESTKREILKHHNCNPDKIIVIPVAISPKFRYKPRKFNKEEPVILQLGTAPNKNIPMLIEALKGIRSVINIVGKRDQMYIDLLEKYGIRYIYESNLSDEEIVLRYENADIISLVSTYEGFGMPILEGNAVGRPVISSNLFSMPEVAGDAACLVNPYEASEIRTGILRIIDDHIYRQQLIENGLKNCKRFDPDVIALKYFELYSIVEGYK